MRPLTMPLAIVVLLASALHCCADLSRFIDNGRLREGALLDAAGEIGGLEAGKTRWLQQRIEALIATNQQSSFADERSRVHHLLTLVHERLLTGQYHVDASQLSTTLSNGDYNCVSSAVIFLATVRDAGYSAKAVLQPAHVRCRIWLEDERRWYDIEPSVPDGRGDRTEARDAMDHERELTDLHLLAKLYYNLGIEALHEQEFQVALRHARISLQLDPQHAEAQDNVVAIINNWSLSLCEQLEFERAISLLRDSLAHFPSHDLLGTNEIHIYVSWMRHRLAQGDIAGVRTTLAQAVRRHPDSQVLLSVVQRLQQLAGQ